MLLALDCSWPQGIGNGKLEDNQMTASTSFNDLHLPYHGRLGVIAPNSLGGWCPYKDDKDEYLQVDLGKRKRVSGNRKSKFNTFLEISSRWNFQGKND